MASSVTKKCATQLKLIAAHIDFDGRRICWQTEEHCPATRCLDTTVKYNRVKKALD